MSVNWTQEINWIYNPSSQKQFLSAHGRSVNDKNDVVSAPSEFNGPRWNMIVHYHAAAPNSKLKWTDSEQSSHHNTDSRLQLPLFIFSLSPLQGRFVMWKSALVKLTLTLVKFIQFSSKVRKYFLLQFFSPIYSFIQ